MSSDRNWMYGPRHCNEYIKGVDAFIDFAKKDMLDNIRGNLCCPCKHCKNEKRYRADDVLMSHLIKHGFMDDYRCWNKHGEEGHSEAEMRDSHMEREVHIRDRISQSSDTQTSYDAIGQDKNIYYGQIQEI
jgi:hypothetical protein